MTALIPPLKRLQRRLMLLQWVHGTITGLFWAATAACVWLILVRLFPLMGEALAMPLAFLGVGAVLAGAWALLRRPSLARAALIADARLGLRERITSSLALGAKTGPMTEAVHRDAERHIHSLNIRRDFPLRVPPLTRWLAVPILLFGLGYVMLPEFDLFGFRAQAQARQQETEARELTAHRLAASVRVLHPKTDAVTPNASAAEIETIAEELQEGRISEKQALARVTRLTQKLREQQEGFKDQAPIPKVAGDPDKLGMARRIAEDIQDGRMEAAAAKLREMSKKLKDNALSDKEKEALKKDLKALAKMLGGESSQLGSALAKALANTGESMENAGSDGLVEAMEAMELSLEDMASAMEQLAMLDAAIGQLDFWQQDLLGPSEFCRMCGKRLAPCTKEGCKGGCEGKTCSGLCAACAAGMCSGTGLGMLGAGHGVGNETGELPDLDESFKPAMLPGQTTQGKMLASILQKSAPEIGEEVMTEALPGTVVQVRQEAEQALTKEEIPGGAKEFVRQYFGTLEEDAEPAPTANSNNFSYYQD